MEENEIQDVDLNNEDSTEEQGEDEAKDEKPEPKPKRKFSDEEQLAIHQREAKKLLKKLGHNEDTPSKSEEKSSGVDYGQLAFHNTKSDSVKIESDEDIEFLEQSIKETGKSQKEIIASKWFNSELKERQEARTSAEAVPKGTKRGGQGKDELQVALSRYKSTGELPSDFELRGRVVDKALLSEKSNAQFYNS